MKPIRGKMFKGSRNHTCNFHDEREWRYIPNLNLCSTQLPLLIPQEEMNPQARETYSLGLQVCDKAWLKFEYSGIRYIIIADKNEREMIIDFIDNELDITEIEKRVLVSKLLIYDELREDW